MQISIKSLLLLTALASGLFLSIWLLAPPDILAPQQAETDEHHEDEDDEHDEDDGYGDDDDEHDEDDDDDEYVLIVDGHKAVQLDDDAWALVGMETEKLASMTVAAEIRAAHAEVLDIAPLIALKTEYKALLAEQKIRQSELTHQEKNVQRAQSLHEVQTLSLAELEQHRAKLGVYASQLAETNTRIEGFLYQLRSSWGERLGSFVVEPAEQAALDKLASYQTSLILLSLPKGESLAAGQAVFVSALNQRETARAASYLDKAYQSSYPLHGESHFYLLETKGLRAGMRLFAWIKTRADSLEGLFVPERAVIWYSNQPWVFLSYPDSVFVRKPLANARRIEGGWLLQDPDFAGDGSLVTSGGQSLLSEEFKWAIPDEDND